MILAALAGCAGGRDGLPQGAETVALDPAEFSATIDDEWWPMAPGSRWVYEEGDQRVEVTVTDEMREILGIDARVVHDVVTEDGELVEDTYDWYAQDYARGLGPVLAVVVRGGSGREELVSVER